MWFRNLLAYRLTVAFDLSAEALAEALATKPARKVASNELSTYGFFAPFGKEEGAPLVRVAAGAVLIATRKEERILPGSVVADEVRERVDAIESDQMRKVYKKERDQIKDEVIQAFLPRAFVRKQATYAAILPKAGLILVDASSPKRAEDLLSTLREAIGTLPVRPVSVKIAPTASLTQWVKDQEAPEGFYVLDECELRDTDEEGGSIRAKRQDLTSDEIQLHMSAGKVTTQLSMAWGDKLSFVVDDKLVIKRLRFEDVLVERAEQDGGDDAAGQFDASFALMALTLAEFVPALLEAFGGEEIPEGVGTPAYTETGFKVPADPTPIESGLDGDDHAEFVRDFQAVTRFVRETMRCSISLIQRKMLWGYNRAARMVEALEAAGVVTAMNSNGGREVIR